MPGTNWYYRPVNSPRYPSTPVTSHKRAYLTELRIDGVNTARDAAKGDVGWMARQKSSDEYKEYLERIARPTLSSRQRFATRGLGFMHANRTSTWDGHYVWHKMDFLADTYRCIYSRHGTVKQGTKLTCTLQLCTWKLRALSDNPHMGGRYFFIPDETPVVNFFQVMEPFLQARGYRLSRGSVPYWLAYGAVAFTERIFMLINKNSETLLSAVVYVNNSYYFNRKQAEQVLGFTALYTYEEAMENSLKYYRTLEL